MIIFTVQGPVHTSTGTAFDVKSAGRTRIRGGLGDVTSLRAGATTEPVDIYGSVSPVPSMTASHGRGPGCSWANTGNTQPASWEPIAAGSAGITREAPAAPLQGILEAFAARLLLGRHVAFDWAVKAVFGSQPFLLRSLLCCLLLQDRLLLAL